jgi:hypothetical protein
MISCIINSSNTASECHPDIKTKNCGPGQIYLITDFQAIGACQVPVAHTCNPSYLGGIDQRLTVETEPRLIGH